MQLASCPGLQGGMFAFAPDRGDVLASSPGFLSLGLLHFWPFINIYVTIAFKSALRDNQIRFKKFLILIVIIYTNNVIILHIFN